MTAAVDVTVALPAAIRLLGVAGNGGGLGWAAVGACAIASVVSGARWLRVAQREHYLADAVSRFALRWWRSSPANVAAAVVAVGGVVATGWQAGAALATALVVAGGPIGLALRGRSAPLAFTRRLRTMAGVWLVLQAAAIVGGVLAGVGPVVAAAAALATPAIVDVALALTAPLERRLSGRFVARAQERLRRVRPVVVAITGSYGKTTTKGYVAHLLAGSRTVTASPASFNNRVGLARAVNEHLAPDTEVFVAEMGTYGPGEIAALCRWVPPDVSVITALGPVHLERFGSEERILAAKSEILERAPVVVLAVDDPRLAEVARRCEASGSKDVWWAATQPDAAAGAASVERQVVAQAGAGSLTVSVGGRVVASEVAVTAQPSNVACAVAVAAALGVPDAAVAERLAGVPTAAHRLEPRPGPAGSTVLDDTYNSNPAGAAAALARLVTVGSAGLRRIVVTPGMVELGHRQAAENERFAAAAAAVATDVVVVGRTNRRALVTGAQRGPARLHRFDRRDQAVAWVRSVVGEGDVVLYENDLPDHYP